MRFLLFSFTFFFIFTSSSFAENYDKVERILKPEDVQVLEREDNLRAIEAKKKREDALKRTMQKGVIHGKVDPPDGE